jgi:hypothetical protein
MWHIAYAISSTLYFNIDPGEEWVPSLPTTRTLIKTG